MRFWVGGYSADGGGQADGIGILHAGAPDAVLAGGDLAFAGVAASAPSPSWLARHPTLDVLYAAQEHAGTVQAFRRTGEESFAPLGEAVDAGALVCHVVVAPDGRSLIASCWGDGRVVRYPLDAHGRIGVARVAEPAVDPYSAPVGDADVPGFSDPSDVGDLPLFGGAIDLSTREVAGDRAGGPALSHAGEDRVSRAHQARFLPGGVVATTDMGLNLVRFWSAAASGLREEQALALPKGSGPRHNVWHPSGHVYVVTELSLEVFVLAPDPGARPGERWRVVGGAPLGAGAVPGSDVAAEIALTRDAEHVVVGLRGSNTLATMRVRGGGSALSPVALVESGVDWPRHHVITRDTVLVAGQRSSEVVSLSIDERTGIPGRVRRRVEMPSPSQLLAAG